MAGSLVNFSSIFKHCRLYLGISAACASKLTMPPKRKARATKEEKVEEEEDVNPPKKARSSRKPQKEDDDVDSQPKSKRTRGKREVTADKGEKAPVKNKTDSNYETIDFACSRKNELGQEWNFKITSWNVDGLRAWYKKGGLKLLEFEKPDVFCLQETKCPADQLPEEIKDLEGYKQYWQASEDKDGYAGVALFSKTEPVSVEYGIDDEEHDGEGRCIAAEYEDFFVVCVYVPNAGRKLVTLPKRLKWNEAFLSYIKKLDEKKPVIVCGDMNVAHNEIDLANPKTNTKNAGFTKEEREGMTEFLNEGFVDTYRKLYPDKTDAYTFWTYMMNCRAKNIGWRLDYFIVSERFAEKVCDNIIRSEVFGADHCPITLFINV